MVERKSGECVSERMKAERYQEGKGKIEGGEKTNENGEERN
jgi:hypothetical protein